MNTCIVWIHLYDIYIVCYTTIYFYLPSSVWGDSLNGDLKMHDGIQIQIELTKL